MKHTTLTVFWCIVVFVASATVGSSLQQEEANVAFKWGFGVIVGEGKDRKIAAITRDTVLKTGDELKMVVELKKACFVYVIYHSSTGEIALLFPYDFKQFTTDYVKGKNYYIPKGRSWFTLDDNTGKETFYLIAATQRFPELESRIEKYKTAKEADKPAIVKDILSEIRNLKKRYKTFATLAERPISVGGTVRGSGSGKGGRPDVANIAIEITANNFYSKTFTIDHQ